MSTRDACLVLKVNCLSRPSKALRYQRRLAPNTSNARLGLGKEFTMSSHWPSKKVCEEDGQKWQRLANVSSSDYLWCALGGFKLEHERFCIQIMYKQVTLETTVTTQG